jgi:hypothetical protein
MTTDDGQDSQGASSSRLESRCLYTAASANRASHIADWSAVDGEDELVYASHKNIVLARNVGVSM